MLSTHPKVGMAVLVGVRVKAKVWALTRRDAHPFAGATKGKRFCAAARRRLRVSQDEDQIVRTEVRNGRLRDSSIRFSSKPRDDQTSRKPRGGARSLAGAWPPIQESVQILSCCSFERYMFVYVRKNLVATLTEVSRHWHNLSRATTATKQPPPGAADQSRAGPSCARYEN